MKYDFDIVHRVCIENQAAHSLLRLKDEKPGNSDIDDDIPIIVVVRRVQTR